jgi:hypothetical protein
MVTPPQDAWMPLSAKASLAGALIIGEIDVDINLVNEG